MNLGYKGQLEFIFQDKNTGVYNYVKNKSIHRISDLEKISSDRENDCS